MTTTAAGHLPRRRTADPAAQWAGWSLLVVLMSLLAAHGGAMVIAGQRATGTDDLGAIRAFYAHRALLPLLWQHGAGVLGFAVFVVSLRRLLLARVTTEADRLLTEATCAIALVVVPLALVEIGLQMAMVQVAIAPSGDGLFGIFAAWDWIYNSLFYWLEAAWMGGLALLARRTGLLPQWIAGLGLVVAAAHVFHASVLLLGAPDAVTLPGNALFIMWFAAAGLHLVRDRRTSA